MKKLTTTEKLDVDVRFLLANERTLLAWVRTSLAIIAGGLAFSQLGETTTSKTVFSTLVLFFGAWMALFGYIRYHRADRAIKAGRLPDTGGMLKVQVFGVVIFAFIIAFLQLIKL